MRSSGWPFCRAQALKQHKVQECHGMGFRKRCSTNFGITSILKYYFPNSDIRSHSYSILSSSFSFHYFSSLHLIFPYTDLVLLLWYLIFIFCSLRIYKNLVINFFLYLFFLEYPKVPLKSLDFFQILQSEILKSQACEINPKHQTHYYQGRPYHPEPPSSVCTEPCQR